MADDKRLVKRDAEWLGRGTGTVEVPATYQSDDPPALDLSEMRVKLSDNRGFRHGMGPKRDKHGHGLPYRLELSLDCNGEAAKRLAEFFGLYDPEAWNRMAKQHGLPEVPGAPQLVAQELRRLPPGIAEDRTPPGGLSDLDPCPCGDRREHHEPDDVTDERTGPCMRPGCDCLGFGFQREDG